MALLKAARPLKFFPEDFKVLLIITLEHHPLHVHLTLPWHLPIRLARRQACCTAFCRPRGRPPC
eukprot:17838-Pelagomonas_calceolata.AAC.5